MSGASTSCSCFRCDAPVDPVRVAVRIRRGRVVRLCGFCLIAERELVEEEAAGEVERQNAPAASRPGNFSRRASTLTELIEAQLMDLQHRKRGGNVVAGIAIVSLALIPVLGYALAFSERDGGTASIGEEAQRPVTRLISLTSGDVVFTELERPPLVDDESWVHPVTGATEKVPTVPSRKFLAERAGERPSECGRGHCGVDLDAPRGSPIVAVRPGVVESAVRDRHRSGGRYVWVRHEDLGMRTEYFHLDEVAPGLQAGDPVVAGQWLGTLGRTGIQNSAPHLHFAVRDLARGLRYLNPTPFLEEADIISVLDLRVYAAEKRPGRELDWREPGEGPELGPSDEPGE